ATVANNDFITSLVSSAYDGSNFQNGGAIDFFVDGTPSLGSVPTRISFSTGSSSSTRKERLKVGNSGDFNFNNGQVFLKQSSGFLGIGTTSPTYRLHVIASGTAVYGISTSGGTG